MIIRQEQMLTLSEASRSEFADRVAEHLQRCFPVDCEALGQKGLHEVIRYGVERAASHGIDLQRDVCKYIDLMFAFGRDFDTFPWAFRILREDTLRDSTVKLERLFSEARRQPEPGVPLP